MTHHMPSSMSMQWWYRLIILLVFTFLNDASLSEQSYIEEKLNNSNGYADADIELDCGMRALFYEMAHQKITWRSDMKDVFDALELGKCNGIYIGDDVDAVASQHYIKNSEDTELDDDDPTFYSVFVDPNKGNDEHSGNQTHPLKTIDRALIQHTRASGYEKKTILLYPGIHFLKRTITLTAPLDNNLTIRSVSSNSDGTPNAWISGGILINSQTTNWKQSTTNSHVWVANLSSIIESNNIKSITGLFTKHTHQRMTLARYPNANVENWNAPNRHITSNDTDHMEWIFPPYSTPPEFTSIDLSSPNNPTGYIKNDSSINYYNWYGTGKAGSCATIWGDEPSYWCSNVSAGGWANVDLAAAEAGRPNIPIGITIYNTTTIMDRFAKWNSTNARGAIFLVQHTQGWAWHMFNVSHIDTSALPHNLTIYFDKGGSQGGRNWQCLNTINEGLSDCNGKNKRIHSGSWYVEGISDELDEESEFYYDEETKELYFYPNQTLCNGTIGSNCIPDLIGTSLKTLIKFEGTNNNPIQGVHLSGIGFRDAAKTYMNQWGVPSGGDWALFKGGALHLEGTENITISDCHFRRLDGNAIMLSSYNRHAHISRSEFSWIGDGAMATWGDTDGYDATSGHQPRNSMVENNVISNIGLYQKQSSGWGQSKAMQSIIRNNVMFNVPRAAINFNDGLGGGNIIEGNVIFNTCRESGDHGAINSWDRMPFLVDHDSGPSFIPRPTYTRKNLILANYNAAQGFDNDDGSSWYYTYSNVFFQAEGFKMDYGGTSSSFAGNLVYGNKQCYGTGDFLSRALADKFENNTCILDDDSPDFGHLYQCSHDDGMVPQNNSYYSKSGKGTFMCGKGSGSFTLEEMQQQGFEVDSSLGITPAVTTTLTWARDILDLHEDAKNDNNKLAIIFSIVALIVIVGAFCYYHPGSIIIAWDTICQKIISLRVSSSSLEVNGREPLLKASKTRNVVV